MTNARLPLIISYLLPYPPTSTIQFPFITPYTPLTVYQHASSHRRGGCAACVEGEV